MRSGRSEGLSDEALPLFAAADERDSVIRPEASEPPSSSRP